MPAGIAADSGRPYYMHVGTSETHKAGMVGAAGRFARSLYQLLANRRKYERQPISGVVKIICKGYVTEVTHVCTCVDISPRGIGIESPERMEPDMVVPLHTDEQGSNQLARVCYCQQQDAIYRIGLEFVSAAAAPKPEPGRE